LQRFASRKVMLSRPSNESPHRPDSRVRSIASIFRKSPFPACGKDAKLPYHWRSRFPY